MLSFSLFAAGAAFIYSATASAVGSLPSQTIGGFGAPLFAKPTEAPKFELVKARLQKKAVTNICTEWTIPGGFGQPECFNSETCLFTTASGYWYEGCGQTSIPYNWITECYPYPKARSSSPPVSVTYCPATAPACGIYAFVLEAGITAYNLGCSSVSYTLFVELLPSALGKSSTSTNVVLNGGGELSITESVATTDLILSQTSATGIKSSQTVVLAPGASATSSSEGSSTSSSSSSSSTPTGAIVGGVVGGIAVLAFIAFLIWFFLRKRKQDKLAAQAHEAQIQANQATAAAAGGSAFQTNNNNNRISEIAGTMKPPAPATNTYVVPPSLAGVYGEKPAATANEQEIYRPAQVQHIQSPHSPPPTYAQPMGLPENHNESEHVNGVGTARPMSASQAATGYDPGLSPVTTPSPQQQQYQYQNITELSNQYSQPPPPLQPQQTYTPRPGFQEMSASPHTNNAAAIPMHPSAPVIPPSNNAAIPMRPAGSPPPVAQELNAHQQTQAVPMRPAGTQEMSGYSASSGGGYRSQQQHTQRFDMNGAPMGEWQELE